MREMFRRSRKYVIILALPYLFLMFLFTYRIDYRITTPGNLTNVSSYIELSEENPQENPVYSVYVMSVERPTFFQFLTSYLTDAHSIAVLPEIRTHIPDRVNFQSGQVSRNTSVDASFITSLELLGMPIEYEIEQIVFLYYDFIDIKEGALEIGDILLTVNGDTAIQEAMEDATCGEYHTFELRRGDETVTREIRKQERRESCLFGLATREYYRITHAPVELTRYDSLIGGPSGGVMQTLYIYNALSDTDLTAGLKIAGTGGIRLDGSISSMGGIREKVFTAHMHDVDVFFVPRTEGSTTDNYHQALLALELIETDMEVVGVETFADVLDYLLRRQAGETP